MVILSVFSPVHVLNTPKDVQVRVQSEIENVLKDQISTQKSVRSSQPKRKVFDAAYRRFDIELSLKVSLNNQKQS
jgi:fatty acid-binding protein DegV